MKPSRARVYGTILFEAAIKSQSEVHFFEILKSISELFHTEPFILKFFNSPLVELEEKMSFLASEPVLHRFLEVLLVNNEFSLFPHIFDFYESLLDKKLGRKEVTIFSAHPLTLERQKEILASLSQKVDLHFKVEETLLDGFRVYWDSKLIPLSSKDFLSSIQDTISVETLSSE